MALVLNALPLRGVSVGVGVHPLLERVVLVLEADDPSREPPLDGSAHGCAVAPAVGVTAALTGPRVVEPSQDCIHAGNATPAWCLPQGARVRVTS